MGEFVAVSNSSFEITVTPLLAPSATIATPNGGTATPASPGIFGINDCGKTEDDNCKVDGDKILVDKITESTPGVPTPPSGGAAGDFLCGPVGGASAWTNRGAYVIPAAANEVRCSGILVMLENTNNTINCACAGSNNASPTPQPFAGNCVVRLNKAGQTVTKAE